MKTDNTRLMHHETNGPLTHLLNNLSGEEGKIWLRELKKFLRKEEAWKNKYTSLKNQGIFDINPVNTKKSDFFKAGKNSITKLWLSHSFKNIFLPLADETIISKGSKVEKLELTKSINDFQIQEEINGKVDTPTDIAATIISLTSAQSKGEDGVLLNNEYETNIFYFKKGERLFRVYVYWSADRQKWSCRCYEADDRTWGTGSCVFTAATETQSSEA